MQGLWTAIAALSVEAPQDRTVLPCVRLQLADGGSFDVYRADATEGPVTMWRVRGFSEGGGGAAQESVAVILGTKDGRAILKRTGADAGMTPVSGYEETTRSLGDLSQVIAAAVRRLMNAED